MNLDISEEYSESNSSDIKETLNAKVSVIAPVIFGKLLSSVRSLDIIQSLDLDKNKE
jgi:hypothetical protein